ncbi:MAG: hypothetical protein R3E66_06105 [bacterium]
MKQSLSLLPFFLLVPAAAMACGYASSPSEQFVMNSMIGAFLSIPGLLLPLGLLIRLRNNIQSWIYSTMALMVAWVTGSLAFGASSMAVQGLPDWASFLLMAGATLLTMAATTMGLYRLRSRKVIAARARAQD